MKKMKNRRTFRSRPRRSQTVMTLILIQMILKRTTTMDTNCLETIRPACKRVHQVLTFQSTKELWARGTRHWTMAPLWLRTQAIIIGHRRTTSNWTLFTPQKETRKILVKARSNLKTVTAASTCLITRMMSLRIQTLMMISTYQQTTSKTTNSMARSRQTSRIRSASIRTRCLHTMDHKLI